MDLKELKKALAGVCVASLVSGAGLTFAGSVSGSGGTDPTVGGTDSPKKEAGQSG
jgi:radical SAM modification target selenobiotic family peptide